MCSCTVDVPKRAPVKLEPIPCSTTRWAISSLRRSSCAVTPFNLRSINPPMSKLIPFTEYIGPSAFGSRRYFRPEFGYFPECTSSRIQRGTRMTCGDIGPFLSHSLCFLAAFAFISAKHASNATLLHCPSSLPPRWIWSSYSYVTSESLRGLAAPSSSLSSSSASQPLSSISVISTSPLDPR